MSADNTIISWILDKHAPWKFRKTSSRKKLPWYNKEIASAVRCRMKAEKYCLSDKSDTATLNDFYITRRRVANLMNSAECQ